MALRLYLFGLISLMLISLGLLGVLIFGVNPYQAPGWILAVFYATFWLFLSAVMAIVIFYLKIYLSNREVIFAHLLPTLRQSFFVGFILTGSLFLQQIRVLNWWAVSLLIFGILLIELFFRARARY